MDARLEMTRRLLQIRSSGRTIRGKLPPSLKLGSILQSIEALSAFPLLEQRHLKER